MSRIRSRDTKPEMLVRKYLFAKGLRYSLHNKSLPGKPDICLTKFNTVVFVNGCFWHGHKGCKYFVLPRTRTKWWKEKINNTIARDQKVLGRLRQLGWNSIIIWECELIPSNIESKLNDVLMKIVQTAHL